MAEIKNSFLRSKMNKDLDDRLIPNGEYRDAQNISVGKSEADDIGALETVLGNELINGVINPVINAVNASAVGVQVGPTTNGSGTSRGIALFGNYIDNATAGFINLQLGMAVYEKDLIGDNYSFFGTITQLTFSGPFTNVSINWNGSGYGKGTTDGRTYRFGSGERPSSNTWIGIDYSGSVIYSSGDLTSQIYVGMVNNSGYSVMSVSYAAAPINQTTITLADGAFVSSQFNPTVTYTLRWPVEIIGTFSSKSSNAIYIFSTDHTGVSQAPLDLTVLGSHHYIQKFSSTGFKTGTFTALVQGGFLNFSIDNPLSGISLVEDLLFFTDNRNQPRKINIINGLVANYYTDESQISVAKYSPYEPISLLDKISATVRQTAASSTTIRLVSASGIKKGMTVVGPNILATDFVTVDYVLDLGPEYALVQVNKNVTSTLDEKIIFLETTMTGESISPYFNGVEMPANTNWPGDPDFLESRFVRFSYRFQFVDNEYSLMAPFTQIAFIPKQKGYFINGDEKNAYQSTILEFMENGVQNIKLNVPLPDTGFNLNQSNSTYRINNIDILYKESDGLAVKVLDSISINDLSALTTSTYSYEYQSRKPFRTLPQAQTTRVFDKVPVKALAQEIAGNRVIYGNFQNQHTPPSSIDYYVTTGDKFTTNPDINNWAEYPNSTLKQNRNYQVGFILSDKYGRSSSVILSSVKDSGVFLNGLQYGGSTVFAGYNSLPSNIKNWFGDSLQVVINQPIEQTTNVAGGAPGLYAVPLSNTNPSFVGFNTTGTTIVINNSLTNPTMTFNLAAGAVSGGVPVADSYLRGEYKDFVKVLSVVNNDSTTGQTTSSGGGNSLFLTTLNTAIIPGMVVSGFAGGVTKIVSVIYPPQNNKSVIGLTSSVAFNSSEVLTFTSNVSLVTCNGAINLDLYSTNPSASAQDPDIKFAYNLPNATGWYSYKIVVRQQEQDYYNVYLPGLLRGYPTQISPTPSGAIPFPSGEENNTANIVLLNDNINKIPRDLNETSDQQRQFRSSIQLFSRVLNNSATTNIQSYPGILTDTAINISTAIDSNMIYSQLSTTGKENLYQIDTNPLVARIDTSAIKGVLSGDMVPFLAIYETEPQESLLDIYWETSQTGLLADLNADIRTGFEGAVGFSSMSMDFDENNIPGDVNGAGGNYGFITSYFYPINAQGAEIPQTAANKATIAWTVGGGASDGEFALYQETAAGTNFGRYRIQQLKAFVFTQTSPTTSEIDFTFVVKDQNGLNPGPILLTTELKNTAPCFTDANGACVTSFDSITKTVEEQIIQTYTTVNGTASATASDKTSGLIYSITDASGLFEINQNGVLQKINPSNVPINTYDVTVTITDAYIAPNYVTPIDGSDFTSKSVSIVQNIVIGPERVNTGVVSTWSCKSKSSYTAGIPQPGEIRTNPAGGAEIYGGWYLAASAMSSTDSSLAFLSSAGNGLNPISADPASGDFTTWHRIGSAALTKGTINFSCNMSQTYSVNPGFAGIESDTIWRVYYRSNTTQPWALATDINNFIPQSAGTTTYASTSSWNGTPLTGNTPSNPGTGGTYTAYGQVNFAYDTSGEYLILAVAKTTRAAVTADLAASWVNANDLNYSECVVLNGNKQETTGGDKYTYSRSGPVAGYVTTGGSSGNRFTQVPYSEYVSVFYTSNSLNISETAATPFYYYYSPINTMVYNVGLSVAKFTATGIKTSGDPTTCNDLLARGTSGACGKPVSQGSNNLY